MNLSYKDFDQLQGLPGRCADFHVEVKKLSRPYIRLSQEQHDQLAAGAFDYYRMSNGAVVTFGTADGGYALMPLAEEHGNAVLEGVEQVYVACCNADGESDLFVCNIVLNDDDDLDDIAAAAALSAGYQAPFICFDSSEIGNVTRHFL